MTGLVQTSAEAKRLLVGTPLAIRRELASRGAEHSLPYSDVTIYIYICYIIFIIYALRVSAKRLLVGTPLAIRRELASRGAEHSLSYSDVTIYIYLLYNIYNLCFACISAWVGCWFVVYIRRFI